MEQRRTLSTFKALLLALALWTFPLTADEDGSHEINIPPELAPWLTGPLLAKSAYTVSPPHWSLKPYFYFNVYTGTYDKHWKAHSTPNFYSTTAQLQIKRGLIKGWDFLFYPQFVYNETEGKHYGYVGDTAIGFGVQLRDSKFKDKAPALKLTLKANIPLGKYQHLNPHLKGTDAIGTGSWLPTIEFHTSKLWRVSGIHYIDMRLVLGYTVGTAVHVKGFNSYGGASTTKGIVYPGNALSIDWAIQYSLTHRWALACDLVYVYANKRRFSGKAGSSDGIPVQMKAPSSEVFSLAPAIEYNWSRNIGIIGGVWFTFAGRNANQFTNGIIALSIYL